MPVFVNIETDEGMNSLLSHSGKTALVTGAAGGIGRAYAVGLARRGSRLILVDIVDASETLAEVQSLGASAVTVEVDITQPESVAKIIDASTEIGAVDILVLNAGIQPFIPFEKMTFEDWRRVMSVNVDSMFHLTSAFLPGMRERGWGRIVIMSSNTYHLGVPGAAHYVASKGAVQGFVRSLAGEVGPDGVTINAIAPGLTRTPGTSTGPQDELGLFEIAVNGQAVKRTEKPEDLVGTLAFLTSGESEFITGQTILVDGGWAHV